MKIVSWHSGFGNQLSLYIFYRWLELKGDDKCFITKLPYDFHCNPDSYFWDISRVFPNSKPITPLADIFTDYNGNVNFSSDMSREDMKRNIFQYCGSDITLVTCDWGQVPLGVVDAMKHIYIHTAQTEYTPEFLEITGDVHYVQVLPTNINYLNVIKEHLGIELDFAPISPNEPNAESNITLLEAVKSTNSVAVHVRYFEAHPDWNKFTRDTILRLVNEMRTRINNPVFFVFSNHIKIAQEELSGYVFPKHTEVYYVNGNKGKESFRDMQIMSECKHFVLNNISSFGYYATILCKNKDKQVLYDADSPVAKYFI